MLEMDYANCLEFWATPRGLVHLSCLRPKRRRSRPAHVRRGTVGGEWLKGAILNNLHISFDFPKPFAPAAAAAASASGMSAADAAARMPSAFMGDLIACWPIARPA